MTPTITAYRAAWVCPVVASPIQDAVVEMRGDEILRLGPAATYDGPAPVDLNAATASSAIVTPGLVNAHTHLEFSDLEQPLGKAGGRITDWIPDVVRRRRERLSCENGLALKQTAIQMGMHQSRQAGVALLGEIATQPFDSVMYGGANRPQVTAFLELIALRAEENDNARQEAFQHLAAETVSPLAVGLSPHAPYTVNLELLEDAIDLSQRTGAPLQMHLAESAEEIEFLHASQGPFREMLERIGAWEDCDLPTNMTIFRYLERLSKAARCVIAHGNYLRDEEIAFLAEHRDHMAVAYCPRTHAFFDHPRHPIQQLLDRGAVVAIGTDSRASNPDLSVFAEMQCAAERTSASPEQLLHAATRSGAVALGCLDRGKIAPGGFGPLTVFGAVSARDPYEALLDQAEVAGTIADGRWTITS